MCPGSCPVDWIIKIFWNTWTNGEFWTKMPREGKISSLQENDGNLSFHSGNYTISCDLIFLHFAGGFTEKI